jgi:hypothetical protein
MPCDDLGVGRILSGFLVERYVRILATAIAATLFLSAFTACGGGNSSSSSNANGPLTGNWQLSLVQGEPRPQTTIGVSGFLSESNGAVTGSVQVPAIGDGTNDCGGIGQLTGSINNQNISFSITPGGTALNFAGTISSDNTSMSGSYQAVGGACFTKATTGTWSALLVPPLNGSFTGTLSDSEYMTLLTGVSPPAPIAVSGTITQSPNSGNASNATLTGTITAVGYPCFTTVSVTGTISGQNVYLDVFNFQGAQIGTLGVPGLPGVAGTPAIVTSSSSGVSLIGTGQGGLALGFSGSPPCPPLATSSGNVTTDVTNVAFSFQ